MKKLIAIFLIIGTVGNFSNATSASFKSEEEAIRKLAAYQPSDLDGEKLRFRSGKMMNIDRMYNDLRKSTKLASAAPAISEDLAFQMERVALITVINNPAADGVEILLPAYIKHTKIFEAAASGLNESDEVLILETLKSQRDSLNSQD